MGLEGRVCVIASAIRPEAGSPIPFYYKIGFRSTSSEFNKEIMRHIATGTPLSKSSCTMFLPQENVEALLAKSYAK